MSSLQHNALLQDMANSYESSGNYTKALHLAQNTYKESVTAGVLQQASHSLEKIGLLQAKVLQFGFLHLLFDEHCRPRPKLVQLLQLLGMKIGLNSEDMLSKINDWAQNNLLQTEEQSQDQIKEFEKIKSKIVPFLHTLGFIEGDLPHCTQYQGALVHGSFLSAIRLRLHFLVEQWIRGIRFSHIYFLSGERPLSPHKENKTTLYHDDKTLLKIRPDWSEPKEFPKTECDIFRLIWDQIDIPCKMRHDVIVHFINAPMKKDITSNKQVQPTTDDTIEYWLKSNPMPGRYLSITNAPYINRQDLVVRAMCPQEKYSFDTVGYGVLQTENIALVLDEIARFIFQTKKILQ